jgi:hypothetical protein
LQALLKYKEVKEATIEHFKSDDYYKRLLNPELKLKFSSDMGVGEVKPKKASGRKRKKHATSAKEKVDKSERHVHEKTFHWGAVLFTFKPDKKKGAPEKSGSYQVRCPLRSTHRNLLGKNTPCRQTASYGKNATEEQVLLRLKWWACKCDDFQTRLDHQGFKSPLQSLPKDIEKHIESKMLPLEKLEPVPGSKERCMIKRRIDTKTTVTSSAFGPLLDPAPPSPKESTSTLDNSTSSSSSSSAKKSSSSSSSSDSD